MQQSPYSHIIEVGKEIRMSKNRKKFIFIIAVPILSILLFCVKITGDGIHAFLGIVLVITILLHIRKNWERNTYAPKPMKRTNYILIGALITLFLTGILVKLSFNLFLIIILHKLSAIIFCVGSIWHMVQHKRERVGYRNVSQTITE